MAESVTNASKVSAAKESVLDRAQAWVVDQAALSIMKLGRCPLDDVANAIDIPVNALLAVVQTSDRLTVVDGDLDLTVCSDNVARSLDRWCNDVMRAVGCSVKLDDLAELLTVHIGKTSDSIASSIRASAASSRSGMLLVNDQLLLTDWLPMLAHDEQEDILLENGVKADLLAALLAKAGSGSFSNIQDFTVRLLTAIQNKPIRHKTLAVAYWALNKGHETAADLANLMCDDRLLWLSGAKGGRWVLSTSEGEYRSLVSGLIPQPELPASMRTSLANDTDMAHPAVDIVPEVVIDSQVVEKIKSDIITTQKFIQISSYGIPDTHIADYVAIIDALDGVTSVGFGRYAPTVSLPTIDTKSIATAFAFPRVEFISEDGEQVEDLVAPESYVGTLKTDVSNPDNQDILDDCSVYTGSVTAQTFTFPLYKQHISSGLIPMCRLHPEIVPWDVEYAPVTVHVAGDTYQCSTINRDGVRCVTGLQGAFSQCEHCDYLATITKLPAVGEFALKLESLLDGEYALPPERCAELDVYKDSESDNPTVVILTQILDDHPKGVTFERALRELGYIRRTSVHKLASILSTNDCFAQKPGTGVWRYNPKRADAGNDIARRTYLKSGF